MKVYTASFPGHYLTGMAVIVADNDYQAKDMMIKAMIDDGLKYDPEYLDIQETNTNTESVEILFNGDY